MSHFCPIGSAPDGQKLPALVAQHPPGWLMSDVRHQTSFRSASDGPKLPAKCRIFFPVANRPTGDSEGLRRMVAIFRILGDFQAIWGSMPVFGAVRIRSV